MIAFYGDEKERTFSANLAAFCAMGVMMGQSVAVVENHNRGRYAGKCLLGDYLSGSDPAAGCFFGPERGEGLPGGCQMINIWDGRLFYIAQQPYVSEQVFEYEFGRFLDYLPELDRYCRYFIVGSAIKASTSREVLDRSHLAVVQIKQNERAFEEFLTCYPSLLSRTYFLISEYDRTLPFSKDRAAKKFGIPRDCIGTIPYYEEYYRYAAKGEALGFFLRYLHCGTRSVQYSFVHSLKTALKQIESVSGGRGGRKESRWAEDLKNRQEELLLRRLRPEYF